MRAISNIVNATIGADEPLQTVTVGRVAAASYRDLLSIVDGSATDEAVLAHAESIAETFDAHIEVMLANEVPSPAVYAAEGLGPTYALIEAERETRDAKADALRQRLEGIDRRHDVRRCDAYPGELQRLAASLSRCADLTIVSRPYGRQHHDATTLEAVLFEGGRAAYVVPHEPCKPVLPEVVVVGWRDTPECAQAIGAAMPFLQRARQVYLVSVTEGEPAEARRQEPMADMVRHLARHDVKLEVRHLPEWSHPADALLNEGRMTGAGLIVAGAYGRSRLREWILGGVTRELLKRSELPLLLAR
ncbi:universal stress protein [Aureimonas sp. Leaf454]|uniref:universal stress protein n=1 Tax=Aureimonas sp. Leaf454 TaxID=1736381 RepID=UPI00138F3DFB|nr:universal stress protein [Aureimonas sp. Leaf454]